MAWVQIDYTTTEFIEPTPIDEYTFLQLKKELRKNPNYEIVPEGESFSSHFSGTFLSIILKFLGFPVAFLIGAAVDGTILVPIFMIAGFGLLISSFFDVIRLFSEAPSFARFKREKREYFNRMRTGIQQCSTYDEFYNAFYR